jgi:indolepyruvate ferredoxin oxidoreductase, beta subunit
MNRRAARLSATAPLARDGGIIKLAIMAVGGQGGAVLTSWIEAMARAAGYAVQATSVAGVAQRTGATIYYIEMLPDAGRAPVFALAPAAGDVDILIAAEMMEAGRAILRGFVTPDRTTLIASTNRALAVSEKIVPGDGIANADEVLAAAEVAAQRLILFDMERVADEAGTVISASLFGALAGSGALPFPRESFEAAIRASGRGVEASLCAFACAYDLARGAAVEERQWPAEATAATSVAQAPASPELRGLLARVAGLPDSARDMAFAGLRKVIDFQDAAYGGDYLDWLDRFVALDDARHGFALTREAAKHVANAMAYDDMIRVADLKTRGARFDRIRTEMGAGDAGVMRLTEFAHPRAAEVVSLLPAALGRRVEGRPALMRWIDRRVNRGRRLRSDRLWPFLQLYALGGLRFWRRRTLRHAVEMAHLTRWLDTALAHARRDYALGAEVLRCRRLVKGYSDTHARGLSKFDRVLTGIDMVAGRDDAADWARRLREAALADEEGRALDGALATIRSFAREAADAARP